MKLKQIIPACVLAAGLVAVARAEDPIKITVPGASPAPAAAPATPAAVPAPAAPSFSDVQLAEEFGWLLSRKIGLAQLDFTPEQVQAIIKGLQAGAQGKDSPFTPEQVEKPMSEFMQRKQEAYVTKLRYQGLEEAKKYLGEVKKKPGVIALPDGLCYEIIKPGAGVTPKPGDTVTVNYTGTLVNGQVFDSSDRAGHPVDIDLGAVIPGWVEGLQKISKGGHIKLYIPPDLAYGDQGNQVIPPSATITFDIELIDVKAPAAPAAAPAAPVTPPPAGK